VLFLTHKNESKIFYFAFLKSSCIPYKNKLKNPLDRSKIGFPPNTSFIQSLHNSTSLHYNRASFGWAEREELSKFRATGRRVGGAPPTSFLIVYHIHLKCFEFCLGIKNNSGFCSPFCLIKAKQI